MQSHLLLGINKDEFEDTIRRIIREELDKQPEKPPVSATEFPELLTKKQAAKLLGLSLPSISLYVKMGHIPACVVGKRLRFNKKQLIENIHQIRRNRQ